MISAVPPATYSTSNGGYSDYWDGILNLAEVEFWFEGSQVSSSKLSATLSSYQDGYPTYLLFDHNYQTFTASSVDMNTFYGERASMTITVTNAVFDTIKIYNRPDCCQGRIRGATLTVSVGNSVVFSDTFKETSPSYTMRMISTPTLSPTSSPTPGMLIRLKIKIKTIIVLLIKSY